MNLPFQIRSALERELETCDHSELLKAARDLSDSYRNSSPRSPQAFSSKTSRLAYLLTRAPATFASVESTFSKIKSLNPNLEISSVLDIGAGAGTASWAAMEVFPEIERLTMIERDREMSAFAARLHTESASKASIETVTGAVQTMRNFEPHDLVVFSYSLAELQEGAREAVIDSAWKAARVLLVVVESGSPRGFSCILSARTQLLSMGAHVVAPCPHGNACPMAAPDWCHFAARVQRSRLHREAKGGALAYEDEKFSFVAVSREPLVASSARILRRPLARKGHIRFDLCTESGLERITVSKKSRDEFRQARHAEWGDSWKP